MTTRTKMPYKQQDSSTTSWVAFFVAVSILAHLLVFLVVFLISKVVPAPKIKVPAPPPVVNITLVPPPKPPPPVPQPPHSPEFVPTDPGNVKNPNSPNISDNDSTAKSQNTHPRDPNSTLPDVTGSKKPSLDLNTTPKVTAPDHPTQPAPQSTDPVKPQQPHPPQPPVKPPTADPTKPPPPHPEQPKPNPQVVNNTPDNPNGLPVLPRLSDPTIAPQTPADPTNRSPRASPPPSFQLNKSDIAGSASAVGPNSADASATPFGRYKAKVYRAVGSLWHDKVDKQVTLLPIGTVRVQYTIYADGTVTTQVLDGGTGGLDMLLSISVNSIRSAAPYDKFDDYAGLREELIKTYHGDGTSFTDTFSFSVYGGE